jgi:membrane-associated tyrosine/threonine-specific cdc2-inhibitory kinase
LRDDALVQPRSAPRKSARPLKRELSLGRPRFAGFDDVAGDPNDAGDRGDDDAMATGGEELFGGDAFEGTTDARADEYSDTFGVAAGETTSDDLDLDAPFVLRRDRDDRDGKESEENGGGYLTASDRFFDATTASTPRPRRDGARDDAFGDFERTSNGLRTLANDAPPPLRAPEKRGRRPRVDGSDSESSGDGVDRSLRRADSLAETKILAQTHLARTNSVRAPDRAQAFGFGFGCHGGVSASAHANGRGVERAATPFLNASASFKENRPPELDLPAFAAEAGDVRLDAFAASRSSARPSTENDDTAPPTGSGRQPHLAGGGGPSGFGTGCPSPVDFRFHDHFDFVTIFGRSPTSEVWLARSKASGVKYCVKRVVAQFRTASERDRYVHEVEAVTFLPPHENVVKYYRAWQEDRHFYAQTELCECGSFGGCLRRAREMERLVDEKDAWAMAAQVARGLAHCHRYGVTHLDVKPDNVFLTRDGTYKIGDFGVAHVAGSGWEVQDGDGDYVAPEILNQSFSNKAKQRASSSSLLGAADVFSLGATLYEAAAGRAPPYDIRRGFAADDDDDAAARAGGEGRPPALGSSVALPAGRSAELAAVIEACTRRNPEARPSAADVAAHAEMILERFDLRTPGGG